jgi:hypothetical protein
MGAALLHPHRCCAGWRLSLALGAVPALILFFGALMLPDTPNSLVERGKAEEGRRVLEKIRGTPREFVLGGPQRWNGGSHQVPQGSSCTPSIIGGQQQESLPSGRCSCRLRQW